MKKHLLLATAAALMAFGAQTAIAQNIAIVNGKAVPKSRLDALAQQVAKSGRKSSRKCATPSLPVRCSHKKLKNWV